VPRFELLDKRTPVSRGCLALLAAHVVNRGALEKILSHATPITLLQSRRHAWAPHKRGSCSSKECRVYRMESLEVNSFFRRSYGLLHWQL
jgi:hypothetical protein